MKVNLRKGAREALYQRVIDSVSAEIAVLDRQGTIVMTNDSWDRFARENQARGSDNTGLGVNYLEVCRTASGESSEGAKEVLAGLREVLSGNNRDFAFEYACHSPTVRRWLGNYSSRHSRFAIIWTMPTRRHQRLRRTHALCRRLGLRSQTRHPGRSYNRLVSE
jgi:PAS domain-containing protein